MHQEPDRVPLDIGGTRSTSIHIDAYVRYREALGFPPVTPRWQIRYLQQPHIDEDFRAWLGVDLESADPATVNAETPVVADESGTYYTDLWGCEWFMPAHANHFNLRRAPLADADSVSDLADYVWPKGDDPRILANLEADARQIWHENGRVVVMGRPFVGVMEMLHYLLGYEKAMMALAGNKPLVEHLMDRVLEYKLDYYRAGIPRILAAGVDFFIVNESEDLGSQDGLLISPKMYRDLLKPRHTRIFQAIKEHSQGKAFVELHSCGAIRALIPDLIESGVEVLNPIQVSAAGMDTAELKRDFGDGLVFHGGGIDSQSTLPYGTPEEVRQEVLRRMDDLAPGGGFIFTPVQTIQYDVPFENFLAMLNAYREFVGLPPVQP